MTRLVRWTEAERAVEADLGVNEVRARIDKLHWPDRYEIVAALATPTTMTPEQAKLWAQFAASLGFNGSRYEGDRIMVDGSRIVRERSTDELAKLVCAIEVAARAGREADAAATPGRPATAPEERG